MMKFYNGNEIPALGLGTWKVSTIFSKSVDNLVCTYVYSYKV